MQHPPENAGPHNHTSSPHNLDLRRSSLVQTYPLRGQQPPNITAVPDVPAASHDQHAQHTPLEYYGVSTAGAGMAGMPAPVVHPMHNLQEMRAMHTVPGVPGILNIAGGLQNVGMASAVSNNGTESTLLDQKSSLPALTSSGRMAHTQTLPTMAQVGVDTNITDLRMAGEGQVQSHSDVSTQARGRQLPITGVKAAPKASAYGDHGNTTEHSIGRVYECEYCGWQFSLKGNLSAHLRRHTGEKPFECHVCSRKFTQSSLLTVHMRTHTGERPFKCQICSRQFSRSGNLTTHMRIHNQVKPFSCSFCGKQFSQRVNMELHTRTHTGVKPYQCGVCDRKFTSCSNMRRHWRQVHPNNPEPALGTTYLIDGMPEKAFYDTQPNQNSLIQNSFGTQFMAGAASTSSSHVAQLPINTAATQPPINELTNSAEPNVAPVNVSTLPSAVHNVTRAPQNMSLVPAANSIPMQRPETIAAAAAAAASNVSFSAKPDGHVLVPHNAALQDQRMRDAVQFVKQIQEARVAREPRIPRTGPLPIDRDIHRYDPTIGEH